MIRYKHCFSLGTTRMTFRGVWAEVSFLENLVFHQNVPIEKPLKKGCYLFTIYTIEPLFDY